MPKIGLRMIKTAISVFICLLIFVLVLAINHKIYGTFDGATKWYTPFFATLAAAYSVATTKQLSFNQAKIRIVASVVGGLIGILVVFIYTIIFGLDWPFSDINSIGQVSDEITPMGFLLSFIVPSLLVALSVIAVIYSCVLINQKQAAFVSVLTLTAVMCSLGTNPIQYGFTRILSTIIGVIVALGVNLFHLPHFKNKNVVFILGVDGYNSNDTYKFSGYEKYSLSTLSYYGARISILSTRTPTTLIPMLDGIVLNCPVLCMNGAALYDTKDKKYLYVENLSKAHTELLREKLKEINVTPFINFVDSHVLYTYCSNVDNEAMRVMLEGKRNSAYSCYVPHEAPHKSAVSLVLVIENEKTENILDVLNDLEIRNDLIIYKYSFEELIGGFAEYSIIKIFSKKVDDLKALEYIADSPDIKKVGVVANENDYHILDNVDYSITTLNVVKDGVVKVNNRMDYALKKIRQIFYRRKIN